LLLFIGISADIVSYFFIPDRRKPVPENLTALVNMPEYLYYTLYVDEHFREGTETPPLHLWYFLCNLYQCVRYSEPVPTRAIMTCRDNGCIVREQKFPGNHLKIKMAKVLLHFDIYGTSHMADVIVPRFC